MKASQSATDVHVRHMFPPDFNPPKAGHFVVMQPWEFGVLPADWIRDINNYVDELWVPSSFVRQTCLSSSIDAARVHVIPNGVDATVFRPGLEPLLPRDNKYRFLFVGGCLYRKGPDCVLRAFKDGFACRQNVTLIIKDVQYYNNRWPQLVEALCSGCQHQVTIISGDLSEYEMARLYNSCDCLVHAYRGEGFGLPVLEAMACQLPVIVTAGGATDDFVGSDTGLLVPAVTQTFARDEVPFGWAYPRAPWVLEPDIPKLTDAMLTAFHRQDDAELRAQRARARVEREWTWQSIGQKILERLQVLITSSPQYKRTI